MKPIDLNASRVSKAVLAIGLLLFILIAPTQASNLPEHTIEVAEDVYSYGGPSLHYTSMFMVTNDGVIVVDPVNTQHAKGLLKAIKQITDQPIKYLLHSHNHWDHASGGQVFRDEGASIIAHDEAREWMKANPYRDMAYPDEGWTGNRKDIVLGGRTIELHYLGMNHGLGMTVFRLPKEKIVYIADLVTPKRLLFTIVPDFNIKETQRTLKEIESMDFDIAIFSHGKPLGSKVEVNEIWQYTEDLRAAIHGEFSKGTSPFTIPNVVKLPKYKNWAMYDEWLSMNAWRVLLDDYMGPFPWRADRVE